MNDRPRGYERSPARLILMIVSHRTTRLQTILCPSSHTKSEQCQLTTVVLERPGASRGRRVSVTIAYYAT
jgi:hypothetical protein